MIARRSELAGVPQVRAHVTAEGPAYTLALMHAYEAAGIHGACESALQLGSGPASWSLISRPPIAEYPRAEALRALAELGGERLAVDCSSNAAALGVGVVATANGRAVVHRWDPNGPADIDVQVRRSGGHQQMRLDRFAVEVFA